MRFSSDLIVDRKIGARTNKKAGARIGGRLPIHRFDPIQNQNEKDQDRLQDSVQVSEAVGNLDDAPKCERPAPLSV
jgi:hypothetical protein